MKQAMRPLDPFAMRLPKKKPQQPNYVSDRGLVTFSPLESYHNPLWSQIRVIEVSGAMLPALARRTPRAKVRTNL